MHRRVRLGNAAHLGLPLHHGPYHLVRIPRRCIRRMLRSKNTNNDHDCGDGGVIIAMMDGGESLKGDESTPVRPCPACAQQPRGAQVGGPRRGQRRVSALPPPGLTAAGSVHAALTYLKTSPSSPVPSSSPSPIIAVAHASFASPTSRLRRSSFKVCIAAFLCFLLFTCTFHSRGPLINISQSGQ